MEFEEETRALDPGDVLVVYTDGLIEARDPVRRQFGIERLIETAVRARSEDVLGIHERILEAMAEHCGGIPPADDVTLVVVKRVDEEIAARTGKRSSSSTTTPSSGGRSSSSCARRASRR